MEPRRAQEDHTHTGGGVAGGWTGVPGEYVSMMTGITGRFGLWEPSAGTGSASVNPVFGAAKKLDRLGYLACRGRGGDFAWTLNQPRFKTSTGFASWGHIGAVNADGATSQRLLYSFRAAPSIEPGGASDISGFTNGVAFGVDDVGLNWQSLHSEGGSAPTTVDTGLAFNSGDAYLISFYSEPGSGVIAMAISNEDTGEAFSGSVAWPEFGGNPYVMNLSCVSWATNYAAVTTYRVAWCGARSFVWGAAA